jgi:hypothetical protein
MRGWRLPQALTVALALGACKGDEVEVAAEVGRVVHAVRMVRRAGPDDKVAPLEVLAAVEATGEALEFRDLCAEAYGLYVRGVGGIANARGALAGKADMYTERAAESLAQAEKDLERSQALAKACADREGELVRRFKLD